MRKALATLTAFIFVSGSLMSLAEDAAPSFPELGRDYQLTFADPPKDGDPLSPFSRPTRQVVFTRHMRGDWYEIAYLSGDAIVRTFLNISHVLAITDGVDDSISKKLKGGAPK